MVHIDTISLRSIRAFLEFINGKFIMFRSSSPQKYFTNMFSIFHEEIGKRTWLVPRTYIFPENIVTL